ncbi:hypothetical protein [Cupriavidus necator]|uniref:hypothetical protein n=1 Tax=Cupriavidus necator TaxID=106590 RepID=UPI00339D788C
MTQDESQQIEIALQAWHRWQQRQSFAEVQRMWYPAADSSCREFQSTDLWEETADMADQADRRVDAAVGEVVDRLIEGLDLDYRVAINLHLMNKDHAVWRSRRIGDAHAAYQAAKAMLLPAMIARGLVKVEEAA